jgi:hypothetical protein
MGSASDSSSSASDSSDGSDSVSDGSGDSILSASLYGVSGCLAPHPAVAVLTPRHLGSSVVHRRSHHGRRLARDHLLSL